ncbi:TlpA family protein disulfide reductase [Flavobacteriaceae bacterium M23B6Z8]
MNKYFGLLIFFIVSSCSSPLKPNQFQLDVSLSAKNTDYIVLSYLDHTLKTVSDTIYTKINKDLVFQGMVNGFTHAWIESNLVKDSSVDDPNRLSIFLESGLQEISLTENEFKNATLKGSKTHLEHEHFIEEKKKITGERKRWIDERNAYFSEYISNPSDSVSKFRMDSIVNLLRENSNEVNTIKLSLIEKNPESYLSVYNLHSFLKVNNITHERANSLYENLSTSVKESIYGKLVSQQLKSTLLAQEGKRAVSFKGMTQNGEKIALEDFEGKYVLLDFWAGWCKPCKALHPELKELYEKYHSQGLEIIGVSFDKDQQTWKTSIEQEQLDQWLHLYDGYKNIGKNNSISQKFNVTPIPAYILIDDRGIIAGRYLGADKENKDQTKNIEDLKEKLAMIFDAM